MIITIQYLRGIAAMLVVLAHIDTQMLRIARDQLWPGAGAGIWGVDIFFVISGLIMYRAAIATDISPGRFLLNRAIRIVPLYWVLTALVAAGAYVVPSLFSSTRFEPLHTLASLLFLPWPNPAYAGYWPVLIPGWTLNFETYFYLAVTVALLLPQQLRLLGAALIMIAAFIVLRSAGPSGLLGFYANDIVLEFVFGLLIGYVFERKTQASPATGAILVGLACAAVLWSPGFERIPRSVVYGVPAAMLVFGSLQFEPWAKRHPFRPLRYLGDISYSLYLTHVIALPAMTSVFTKLVVRLGPAVASAYPPIAAITAIALAALSYRLLEQPLTRWFRRFAEAKLTSQALRDRPRRDRTAGTQLQRSR